MYVVMANVGGILIDFRVDSRGLAVGGRRLAAQVLTMWVYEDVVAKLTAIRSIVTRNAVMVEEIARTVRCNCNW